MYVLCMYIVYEYWVGQGGQSRQSGQDDLGGKSDQGARAARAAGMRREPR